jgi:PAS domain S-box-containing protein
MNPSQTNPTNTPAPPEPRRLEAFPSQDAETGAIAGMDCGEVLDSVGDPILVHELSSGRILHANAAACHMFGYDLGMIRRRAFGDLGAGTPPHGHTDIRRWFERAGTEGPQLFEWLARAANGRCFWVEVGLRAGRGAAADRGFATIRDISRRKALAAERERATEELRRGEERFRLLLGRMPAVAVQGCGPDGVVRYWNEASEQLYGYTAAEAVGQHLVALIVPPPLRDEMRVTLHQMLCTGQPLPPAEFQLQRKDGSIVSVFSSHTVVAIAGASPELYRLDFDLSDRKRLEAERLELERGLMHNQKFESLGVLAGGIAHDFNNLLTGVLGNLELARSELPSATPAIPLIDDAITAARLAANLTHQMLAYAGRTHFQRRPLDLGAVIGRQRPLLHAATAGRANLSLDLAPALPEIEADADQLGQLLVNLVTNAAESIEAGRIGTVEVRTGLVEHCTAEQLAASRLDEKPSPQPFVELAVADDGAGMDTATAQRVFDPFYSTRFAGRGLGLPVVLGIVRAHRGAIFLDSSPGRGSVVRVLLPLARPPEDGFPAAAAPSAPPADRPLRGLLLVVDDEDAVRRIAERMGQRLGLEVITAPDGESAVALSRLHAGNLSCALIDLTMPGMNGFECLQALREIQPALPAVLSSGCAAVEVIDRTHPAGFVGFLPKPFSFERFAELILTAARSASSAEDHF